MLHIVQINAIECHDGMIFEMFFFWFFVSDVILAFTLRKCSAELLATPQKLALSRTLLLRIVEMLSKLAPASS